jgi:hypothetical protein
MWHVYGRGEMFAGFLWGNLREMGIDKRII